MTKAEIRAVSVAQMELTEDAVVYDIGAGTGSVSVEIALSGEKIKVYAIEKNPEGVELIRQNRKKFRVDGIRIIEGNAPEVLEGLEMPTHVFIGGSSGNLLLPQDFHMSLQWHTAVTVSPPQMCPLHPDAWEVLWVQRYLQNLTFHL